MVKLEAHPFYIKCPFPGCLWQSSVFDSSYWHVRGYLDIIRSPYGYRGHYERDHAAIPVPEYVVVK